MALSVAGIARMSRLLDEALSLDLPQRRNWLNRMCAEHAELATVLRQSLLPQTGVDTGAIGLETLPRLRGVSAHCKAERGVLKAGGRLGPYELVRPLGTGGMAEVWFARRADGAFAREVALKVPLLSTGRPDLMERFDQERNVLAGLEHANIARMYDAGLTPEGLPFLAMEYVPGEPLVKWCDGRRLRVRERITLFLQVLDAVKYAHTHNVVHRDLKPSNILVTQEGQVRLLDFGVAGLLNASGRECTHLTRTYGRALTPDYASPELLRGDRADLSSDVYSLGIVLHELLTGSRPYRVDRAESFTHIVRQIGAVRIARPSAQLTTAGAAARATTRRRLKCQLCGDLDAIVIKALSSRPRDRYVSAAALADDLSHYLAGKVVGAQKLRGLRRASRFLLCRGAAFAAAAAAAAAMAVLGLALARSPAEPALRAGVRIAATAGGSIAVLPFADLSEKHDKGYIAEGIAETIRHLLSPELRVASRTPLSRLQDRKSGTGDFGDELEAAHVLEGSVQNAGSRLRINARLVRPDGFVVWSRTYERAPDDTLALQDDIACAVAQAVRASLSPRGGAR